MKRLLAIAVAGLAALVAVLLTVGAGGGSGDYRVDAIFDSADFLISGQDVKVAGARVGQVTKVALTNDRKARIEMQIVPGFAPFRPAAPRRAAGSCPRRSSTKSTSRCWRR